MSRFKDKVVLVTGGARGMGKTHVEGFLNEGAFVFFTDILEAEGLAVSKELGNNCEFIKQDVSSQKDWEHVVEIINSKFGKLDVLINNAGIARFSPIAEMPLEDYMRSINVNQVSVFLGLKHCYPLLKKGESASVVNISSVAGLKASKGGAGYNSSKFAVNALSGVAASEWAAEGIRVNTVCPGAVETPMIIQEDTKDLVDAFIENIPLKKIGKPEELTKMVMFLASSESSFTTGAIFVIDGGSMLV